MCCVRCPREFVTFARPWYDNQGLAKKVQAIEIAEKQSIIIEP